MTFQTREIRTLSRPSYGNVTANSANSYSQYGAIGTPDFSEGGLVGVAQALTTLKDQDPAFNKLFSVQKWEQGKVIATASDLSQKMYVLMSGRVNMVCTNNEGRRLVITTLNPGAIFGEGALDQSSDPTVFVEAAEASTVWTVPASEARQVAVKYPILSWGLLQTYGERLLQVENSLEDVAYKKLPERLAMLLLDYAGEDGLIEGVSHQALADHLGTYRETVSAILRDFKRQDLVQLGYRRIQVNDIETMKDIAGIWD